MDEIQNLKKQILKEYPRLDTGSEFEFRCGPDVPCFNDCCGDVNIFLTPYDVIRLKNKLGMSSTEFLRKHTISPMDKNLQYPVILLQMQENEKKTCPFVTEQGCSVYADRPWACRMYPLGLASPGDNSSQLDEEFYFLLKEDVCKGFCEKRPLKVSDWLEEQGINEYNEMGELFKDLTTHKFFNENGELHPGQVEMFFMVCYDVDRFRQFVFESSFLNKFVIEDHRLAKMKEDDIEMLRFGYDWLRFSIFHEPTVKIREDVVEDKKKELMTKGKLSRDKHGLKLS